MFVFYYNVWSVGFYLILFYLIIIIIIIIIIMIIIIITIINTIIITANYYYLVFARSCEFNCTWISWALQLLLFHEGLKIINVKKIKKQNIIWWVTLLKAYDGEDKNG